MLSSSLKSKKRSLNDSKSIFNFGKQKLKSLVGISSMISLHDGKCTKLAFSRLYLKTFSYLSVQLIQVWFDLNFVNSS